MTCLTSVGIRHVASWVKTSMSKLVRPQKSTHVLKFPPTFPYCKWRQQQPNRPPSTCCVARSRRPHDGALTNERRGWIEGFLHGGDLRRYVPTELWRRWTPLHGQCPCVPVPRGAGKRWGKIFLFHGILSLEVLKCNRAFPRCQGKLPAWGENGSQSVLIAHLYLNVKNAALNGARRSGSECHTGFNSW